MVKEESLKFFFFISMFADMAEPIYSYEVEPRHLSPLSRFPIPGRRKTLEWLENFTPKEPIFPGGNL